MAGTARRGLGYVEGNTVRKTVPQRPAPRRQKRILDNAERERLLSERERGHHAQQERLRTRSASMDRPFLVLLILASCCTLSLCFNYIQLQTEMNARISSIEQKKQTLERLRSENDALRNSIDTSLDPNEIYRVATRELGMVYAGEDQVITFDKTESEYVRQYEDIPKY